MTTAAPRRSCCVNDESWISASPIVPPASVPAIVDRRGIGRSIVIVSWCVINSGADAKSEGDRGRIRRNVSVVVVIVAVLRIHQRLRGCQRGCSEQQARDDGGEKLC